MRLKSIGDRLERHDYPATTSDVIRKHGDQRVELADGTERLEDVLSRFGEETFHCPDDVYDAIRGGVCHRGVGRRFYSDRDPFTLAEEGPAPLSF